MGNGNSVPTKQTKDRRKETDYKSTDGSRSRRPVNGNHTGGSNNGGGSTDPRAVKKVPRATNPFIIFFLRLRSKKPREHVTVIARVAGKLWARMSSDKRKKYIDLANAEKKRREERKRKRKITRCGVSSLTLCIIVGIFFLLKATPKYLPTYI